MAKQVSVEGGHQEEFEQSEAVDVEAPGYPTDDDFDSEPVNHYVEDFEEESDNPEDDGIDEEENDNDDDGEEEEEEDVVEPVESTDKSAKYFQAEWHKTQAELKRIQQEYAEIAEYRGVIERLKGDEAGAKMLMRHWSGESETPAAPQRPTPPEDFDPMLMYTPGTKEYAFREAEKEYDRQMFIREAEERAAQTADARLKPLRESQQAAAQKAELLRMLATTGLPPEEFDNFLQHQITDEERLAALTQFYMQSKGIETGKKAVTQAKRKEFARVKENAKKPQGGKKTGESQKPMSDSDGYMAGLKAYASRGMSFG